MKEKSGEKEFSKTKFKLYNMIVRNVKNLIAQDSFVKIKRLQNLKKKNMIKQSMNILIRLMKKIISYNAKLMKKK